jgi:hypothetical protein
MLGLSILSAVVKGVGGFLIAGTGRAMEMARAREMPDVGIVGQRIREGGGGFWGGSSESNSDMQ